MMYRKDTKKIVDEEKIYKDTLLKIVEFLNLWKEEINSLEKPNWTTKDYTLHQFQCYIWRRLLELNKYKNKHKNNN